MRVGAGNALAQGIVDGGGGALVGGEEVFDGVGCRVWRRRHLMPKSGKYQPDFWKF